MRSASMHTYSAGNRSSASTLVAATKVCSEWGLEAASLRQSRSVHSAQL